MRFLALTSHSEEQTRAAAEKLAPAFDSVGLVVLTGELGAGKTEFVRGLVKARGLDENEVNSPSYTFVNEYPGDRPLYHFDLYRLGDPSELYEIGWDEYLARDGLVVVEWGEKAEGLLSPPYYRVLFDITDETERRIDITLVND